MHALAVKVSPNICPGLMKLKASDTMASQHVRYSCVSSGCSVIVEVATLIFVSTQLEHSMGARRAARILSWCVVILL